MKDILKKKNNKYYIEVINDNYTVKLDVVNCNDIDNIEELVGNMITFDVVAGGKSNPCAMIVNV